MEPNANKEPPVGLKPRWLHDMARAREILGAMHRYAEKETPIPVEWVEEMADISWNVSHGRAPWNESNVIRCFECEHCSATMIEHYVSIECDIGHNKGQDANWYCADGEKKRT